MPLPTDDTVAQLMGDPTLALEGRAAGETVNPEAETRAADRIAGLDSVEVGELPALGLGAGAGASASAGADLEIRGAIGEGGMGRVDLARQRSLRREVAVKRVKGDSPSAEATRLLLREAMLTGALEHPAIVPVHALGRDTASGQALMVMKKVEGVSWDALVRDASHPAWERVSGDRLEFHLRVFEQVCQALELAHSKGVVHRDVKPDNVMVGAFGEVYLMDWGIALRQQDAERAGFAGTPAFMAPEMVGPSAAGVGPESDVYLLGATLHTVLTGQPRHRGDGLAEVLTAAAVSAPVDYAALEQGTDDGAVVPGELGAICNRATAADPGERFESVAALRRAVAAFLAHRSSLELTRGAAAELAAMRGLLEGEGSSLVEAVAVHRHYQAARFGFEQALRSWPENPAARRGMTEAIRAMAGFEIASRNAVAAAALVAELEDPGDLPEALSALEADLATEARQRDRLRSLAADYDATVSAQARRRALFAGMAGIGTLVIYTMVQLALGQPLLVLRHPALMTAVALTLVAAVFWVGRRSFFRNRINRQMSTTVLLVLGGVVVHRIVGTLQGRGILEILSGDALIAAVTSGLAAMIFRRVFVIPCVLLFIAAVLTGFFPGYTPLFVLPALFVSVASLLLVNRLPFLREWAAPLGTEPEEPGPPPG